YNGWVREAAHFHCLARGCLPLAIRTVARGAFLFVQARGRFIGLRARRKQEKTDECRTENDRYVPLAIHSFLLKSCLKFVGAVPPASSRTRTARKASPDCPENSWARIRPVPLRLQCRMSDPRGTRSNPRRLCRSILSRSCIRGLRRGAATWNS